MKMDRKEFFSRIGKGMAGVWGLVSFGGAAKLFSAVKREGQEDQMAQKKKFVHDWVLNLMNNMDRHMAEEEKITLLEHCGRACAESHAKAEASKHTGNLEGWLGVLKKWVGPENVRRKDDVVQIVYSKCLCPLVQDQPPLMSKTYCNCSRGWLLEVFETVVGKPVEVELEDSIMQDGSQCRFSIRIS
jgi:predicted hydrocarbon binding protein